MITATLNNQPELFYSIQGEGTRTGCPAVFLRLAGCNLRCSWCDTKYSWSNGSAMAETELATRIRSFNSPGLVITGGEPLLQTQAIETLLPLLPDDLFIEIETNGTIAPSPALSQRVNQWNVSPKLSHAANSITAINKEVLAAFVATGKAFFKFVVQHEDDWASICELGLPQNRIILMPCATNLNQLDNARENVVNMCLQHRVRFGDRLHIAIWGDKKGV